jgi:hypothetical protein
VIRSYPIVAKPPTGQMIRAYLLSLGPGKDYVYSIYKHVRAECEVNGWRPPSAKAITNYMSTLKRLGLVLSVNTEEAPELTGRIKFRSYYRINPAKVADPGWGNAYKAAYPLAYLK